MHELQSNLNCQFGQTNLPVDPIAQFLEIGKLPVLCRVSKAFQRSFLYAMQLALDTHKRAVNILLGESVAEEFYAFSPQETIFSLYTRLITTTPPKVFDRFTLEVRASYQHMAFYGPAVQERCEKRDLFLKVYRVLSENNIGMAHKWAIKAWCHRDGGENNGDEALNQIFTGIKPVFFYQQSKQQKDEWFVLASKIASEISDKVIRSDYYDVIARAFLKEGDIEKVEELLKSVELSERARGNCYIRIARVHLTKGATKKADDLLEKIITCNQVSGPLEFMQNFAKEQSLRGLSSQEMIDALTIIALIPLSDSDRDLTIDICLNAIATNGPLNVQFCNALTGLPSPCAEELVFKYKTKLVERGQSTDVPGNWQVRRSTPPLITPSEELPPAPVVVAETPTPSSIPSSEQAPQPFLPQAPHIETPEPIPRPSLLSSYWNDSLIFRICSFLSCGLLPLGVYLWEKCCASSD